MILVGKVLEVAPEKKVTEDFRKRELTIDEGGKFPQQIPVEFLQERADLIAELSPGTRVKVSCNIRGRVYEREGETRRFAWLEGWKVEVID